MKFILIQTIILSVMLISCSPKMQTNENQDANSDMQNKGYDLVKKMVQKVGDYKSLSKKKDVVYTYKYQTPDGKADVSTEKYIFDGELSYGSYLQHERTFPELQGRIDQGYDGTEFWLKHNGTAINDTIKLKRVAFTRPTNFYWFTMFQKLLDPGVEYEYIGESNVNGEPCDVVKITFNFGNQKPTDIYQLYINKQSSLVDQFLFTVADFGVMEIPNLMKLEYEEVDGMLIPTKRLSKKSTWQADISSDPWVKITWSDIKFNNGLTSASFKK